MGLAALAVEAIAAIVEAVEDGQTKDAETQAKIEAKLQSSIQIMTADEEQVTANMAARDAATEKRLADLEAHVTALPDEHPQKPTLMDALVAVKDELVARVTAAPLPTPEIVKDTSER